MSIQSYIREIGRGRDGAKALTREQAADLMGMILDDKVSELQLGAFCLAMRIKGETEQEMAGFLDAAQARLNYFTAPPANNPAIVIPSYNGARRLPVLTPLLGILLAREGFAVLMHGSTTELTRVPSQDVLKELGFAKAVSTCELKPGELVFADTNLISPQLQRLLDVRSTIGLRNSAHSMVKLLQPVKHLTLTLNLTQDHQPKAFLITSYTHPEYATSMRKTLELMRGNAVLMRGCEGEAVADARRAPAYAVIRNGELAFERESEKGSVAPTELFSGELSAKSIAAYTSKMLSGLIPIPKPILDQIAIIKLASSKF